jgi:hypothetical protein
MKQTVLHRLPLLLPERDALIPLRHLLGPDPSLDRGFFLGTPIVKTRRVYKT